MSLGKTVIAATMAVALAGCSTINPYTGQSQTSKAAIGAGLGAVAGGVIGALTAKNKEDRAKNAMIGAGIGGVAGGGVGFYMDQQEAKLRQKLEGTGVSVTRNGDQIILNMPGEITFDVSKSSLNADFHNTLDGVVLVLEEFDSTLITIVGHTDSTGSETYNQKLSEDRASSVASYLMSQGVVSARVEAVGAGETVPKYDNSTAEGQRNNRRVELTLDPIVKEG